MELKFTIDNITVKYKIRKAKQDRKHLVVVFAGVTPGKHDFYGFEGGALDHIKGTILWIKDSFEENNTYYLCSKLEFSIERAVSQLIETTLASLDLGPENCTLFGGSKGGSAALHIGLKGEYLNIVASVPQTRIGTYIRKKLPQTFAYMANADEDESENQLNDYIPNLIANPSSHKKNIYIISSKDDPEYAIHIEPLVPLLDEFDNFNLVITDSTLVKAHPDVTPYNIPIILSTLYALCDGIAPAFGRAHNGNGPNDRKIAPSFLDNQKASYRAVAGFHWVQLRGKILNFRGYAARVGEASTQPPRERPRLVALVNGVEHHSFDLDSLSDKTLNYKLYDNYFCDYTWSGLMTPDDKGVSIDTLPPGTYDLAIVNLDLIGIKPVPLSSSRSDSYSSVADGHLFFFQTSPEGAVVTKRTLDSRCVSQSMFSYSDLKIENTTLIIKGIFYIIVETMKKWNHGLYVLTLSRGGIKKTFPLASSRIDTSIIPTGDYPPEEYLWSGFSTPGHKGINLEGLDCGSYDCYVSLICDQRIYTGKDRFVINVDGGSIGIVTDSGSSMEEVGQADLMMNPPV